MRTLLITGGCGFVGSNLCQYLLTETDYRLRVLDNLSAGREGYLASIQTQTSGSLSFTQGDICDTDAVEKAVEGVDAVVHLAAIAGIAESLKDPDGVYEVNVMGTLNLLEACRSHDVERFILASSNAVVGEKAPPIHEEMLPKPISPYGASKLACEGLCSAYHGSFGIKAIALRFSNVYGPYCDHKASAISAFIRRAKQGKPLVIFGDGRQTRDFIHATDIARAIELAMHYKPDTETPQLIFQIGTGVQMQVREVARRISKLVSEELGRSVELEFRDARPGEVLVNYSDPRMAEECLGFVPQIALEEGLSDLWKWFDSSIDEP